MAQKVTIDSEWFVISMSWIKQWQQYVYLDLITADENSEEADLTSERPKPGPVDCSDIIQPLSKHHLLDQQKAHTWQNVHLKRGLKEGEDFMIVDKKICNMWQERYKVNKEAAPIHRYGIKQADGETTVELYLKRLQFVAFPNKTLFKFDAPHTIYLSKVQTVQDLEKKICRCLNGYLYFTLKNKQTLVSKVRLWKSLTNNVE